MCFGCLIELKDSPLRHGEGGSEGLIELIDETGILKGGLHLFAGDYLHGYAMAHNAGRGPIRERNGPFPSSAVVRDATSCEACCRYCRPRFLSEVG